MSDKSNAGAQQYIARNKKKIGLLLLGVITLGAGVLTQNVALQILGVFWGGGAVGHFIGGDDDA